MKGFVEAIQEVDLCLIGPYLGILVAKYAEGSTRVYEEM